MHTKNLLMKEAESFIKICYEELGCIQDIEDRLREVEEEIEETNTYTHTFMELVHGARMAWRNSNKCIGRFFWDKLHVLDRRDVKHEEDVYEALLEHLEYSTNDGKIRPTITIFRPYVSEDNQIQIFNHQLIRYAGYEGEERIVGDPLSIDFTKQCEELGWEGEGTNYDVLPFVYSVDGRFPIYRQIPQNYVKEVTILHPDYNFSSLDLKWYGVPIISDMTVEIGGIHYTAAPFNGWYMGTEIGVRNFGDEARYNRLKDVAEVMDLDTSIKSNLWKDKALVELNVAVLHSFKEARVSIVDHHTASEQFKRFEEEEIRCGRKVTGRWSWLISPLSPSTTHVFHQRYEDEMLSPMFYKKL